MSEADIYKEPTYQQRFQSFVDSAIGDQNPVGINSPSLQHTLKRRTMTIGRALQREDVKQFADLVIEYIGKLDISRNKLEVSDTFINQLNAFLQKALAGDRNSARAIAEHLQERGSYADPERFVEHIATFILEAERPDSQIPNHAAARRILHNITILCSSLVLASLSVLIMRNTNEDAPTPDAEDTSDEMRQPAGEEDLHTQDLGSDTSALRQRQSQLAQASLTKLRDEYSNMDPSFSYRAEEAWITIAIDALEDASLEEKNQHY